MDALLESLARTVPEAIVCLGLLLVVVLDSAGGAARRAIGPISVLSLLLALVALSRETGAPVASWSGMIASDPLSALLRALILLGTLLVLLSFDLGRSRELKGLGLGEFHALLLAVAFACLLLASANDLVMVYLALEMVSIPSYVLVAYLKRDPRSNEAALKYLLFGAASSGTMLYGLSLVYGIAGTTSIAGVSAAMAGSLPAGSSFGLWLAALLVFAGFGFKVAAVPFHFWCPDAYEGAPTPVAAFLSVVPKTAGFAVMMRFCFEALSLQRGGALALVEIVDWPQLLMWISVATMTLGNVAALTQTNMKRLLAYSSIAHAGYVMMGVVAMSEDGGRGVLVYLFTYVLMNLGAFGVVAAIHASEGSFDLRDYAGLHRRSPLLALAMATFLLSLMGLPPFVGFFGKLYVFGAIIARGPEFYWYAGVGAVNAAVAAFYYFRVMRAMVIDPETGTAPALSLGGREALALCALAALNVLPTLAWGRVDEWTRAAMVLLPR
ncbi:MAG: NADH-quinone oxidoreductase subunit N [Vicinamibacteria bacterium]|nr:NADH-quinone oxidoreductase subunit N [Vicinamibacteria bacterium]